MGWHARNRAVLREKAVATPYIKKERSRTSGGPGVRNPSTSAESMGSVPGSESSHTLQASQLLKPVYPRDCFLQQEKLPQ